MAFSLLAAIAAGQIAVFVWAYATRFHAPSVAMTQTPSEATAATSPVVAPINVEDPNFAVDPLKTSEPATPAMPDKPVEPPPAVAAVTPPKPAVSPARLREAVEPEDKALFKEAIRLGKLERERGEMNAALNRFREASTVDPKSPEAIFEIAFTLEKMQLADKAAEQWRRLYDMGESAGAFFTTAELKLNKVKEDTIKTLPPATVEAEEGIAPGKTLGLLNVISEDVDDRSAAKHLVVRIPIKARAREKVDVKDLTVQVLFHDILDNQNLVQTTANVSSRWTTAPADWLDSNVETLEVNYQLPLQDAKAARRENRKYFGYLIRIYYKGEFQAGAGEPERLLQQFPPEPKLPDDVNKK